MLAAYLVLALGQLPTKMPLPLHIEGTRVLDSKNRPVRLRGVNVASLEWDSKGEGHVVESVRVAIRDWKVNHVRLPLAQDRWFGVAPEQHDKGVAYRALVRQLVDECAQAGVWVMLDLHWNNAGQWGKNIGQHVMPDRNSITFWRSVAREYRNHPAVIFDLYNEPHDVSWDMWLRGGTVTERVGQPPVSLTFHAVGMQEMLDVVRSEGAWNLVVVGGLNWSYDFDGILAGRQLRDPYGNGVLYANHAYPFKGESVEKWIERMERATRTLPVIVSEFGSDPEGGAGLTGEQWVRQVLNTLESKKWHWTAWDFHPAAGPSLISGWDYAPTAHLGALVKASLVGTKR